MNQLLNDLRDNTHILIGAGVNVITCYKLGCYKHIMGLVVNFISSIVIGLGSVIVLHSAIDVGIMDTHLLTTNTQHLFEFCVAMLGVSSMAYMATKINKLFDVLIDKQSKRIETKTEPRSSNDYYD